MIQAYRRGELRSTFPHGKKSRIRENLLLEAIQTEGMADGAEKRLALAGSLLGPAPMKPESRQHVMKEFTNDLRYFELLRMLDSDGAEDHRFKNSSLAIQAVYEILQRVGIIPK